MSLLDDLLSRKNRLVPQVATRTLADERTLPRMTEDERRGILGTALDTTLSAVGRAGDAFDDTFGGRAIRGVLAGKPQEAVSLLPTAIGLGLAGPLGAAGGLVGSWLFNLVTHGLGKEEDRTSGAELISKWTGAEDPSPWLSIPLEIALDPSTFIGGGLTKAGKIVGKAGLTDDVAKLTGKAGMGVREAKVTSTFGDVYKAADDLQRSNLDFALKKSGKTLDELAGQKLDEGFRIGLPFTQAGGRFNMPLKDFPGGGLLDKALRSRVVKTVEGPLTDKNVLGGLRVKSLPFEEVAKNADTQADWLRKTAPVAALNRLFVGDALHAYDPELQMANQEAMKKSREGIYQQLSGRVAPAMGKLDEKVPGIETTEGGEFFRQQMEFGDDPEHPERFLEALFGKEHPANVPYFARKEAGKDLMTAMDDILARKQAAGLATEEYMPKFYRWFTRNRVPGKDEAATRSGMTRPFSDAHREEMLALVPRGTQGLEVAVKDENIFDLYDRVYAAAPGGEEQQALADLTKYVRENVQDMPETLGEEADKAVGTWSVGRRTVLKEYLAGGHKDDPRFQYEKFDREYFNSLPEEAAEKYNAERKANNLAVRQAKARELKRARREFHDLDAAYSKSENLADWIVHQKPNVFGHPVADAAMFIERGERQIALANEHVRLLAKRAQMMPSPIAASAVPKDMVRADEALESLGFVGRQAGVKRSAQDYHHLTDNSAISFLRKAEEAGHPYSLDKAIEEAAIEAAEAAGEGMALGMASPGQMAREELKRWFVPKSLVKDMLDSRQRALSLKELEVPLKRYRQFTGFWKELMTIGRPPAFYSRNYLNAGYQNTVAGVQMFDPADPVGSVRSILRRYSQSHDILRGKTPDLTDIYGGTPQEALQKFRAEALGAKLTSTPQLYVDTDIPNRVFGSPSPQQHAYEQLSHARPGVKPSGYKRLAGELKQAVKDKLPLKAIRDLPGGIKASLTDQPLPEHIGRALEGGRRLNAQIEGDHRIAAYLFLRGEGVEPVTAAKMVNDAHVSYTKSSQFERKFMKGIVPFYTWPREMAEAVVRHTADNPAGPYRQFARVEKNLAEDKYDLPPHVAANAAIPVGGDTYITNLADLPPELFNKLLAFGPNSFGKTLANLVGQVNPLLKVWPELGFNRSLYDNRDLRDKNSRIGQTLTDIGLLSDPHQVDSRVDIGLNLVPGLAQGIQMAGQWTDARKNFVERLVNWGTGIKLASVTPEDREYALRNAIESNLHGAPGVKKYSNMYVANESLLTENQKLLLDVNKDIQAKARDRKKAATLP